MKKKIDRRKKPKMAQHYRYYCEVCDRPLIDCTCIKRKKKDLRNKHIKEKEEGKEE